MTHSKMLFALVLAAGMFSLNACGGGQATSPDSGQGGAQGGAMGDTYEMQSSTAAGSMQDQGTGMGGASGSGEYGTGSSQGGAESSTGTRSGSGSSMGGTQQSTGSAQGGAAQEKKQKMTATVQSVDQAANTITVQDEQGMTRVLTIGSGIKMTRDGKDVMLSDLQPGERLQVSYTGSASSPTVEKIKVMGAKSGTGGAQGGVEKSTETKSGTGGAMGGSQGSSQGGTQEECK